MLIAGILEDEGYETREAANSAEALDAVRQRRPALVILDIWLQGSELDGLQLLDVIRREEPPVPVVMISGHGTIETAVAAIKNGAYDFIEKPFKADRLLLVVDRAIEAARLRRENAELRRRAGGEVELRRHRRRGRPACAQQIERVAPTGSRVLITGAGRRRQGSRGAPDPSALAARRRAVRRAQLRDACRPSGSRSSCSAPTSEGDGRCAARLGRVRAGAWRHAAARRSRRHAAGDRRARSCARAAGADLRAGRRHAPGSRSMCACSPRPTATCRPRSPPGASARICSTG